MIIFLLFFLSLISLATAETYDPSFLSLVSLLSLSRAKNSFEDQNPSIPSFSPQIPHLLLLQVFDLNHPRLLWREEDEEDDEEEDQDPLNVSGECRGRFRRACRSTEGGGQDRCCASWPFNQFRCCQEIFGCGKNLQMEEMKVDLDLLVGDPASLEKKIDAIRFGGP